jgi:hypothetical protein
MDKHLNWVMDAYRDPVTTKESILLDEIHHLCKIQPERLDGSTDQATSCREVVPAFQALKKITGAMRVIQVHVLNHSRLGRVGMPERVRRNFQCAESLHPSGHDTPRLLLATGLLWTARIQKHLMQKYPPEEKYTELNTKPRKEYTELWVYALRISHNPSVAAFLDWDIACLLPQPNHVWLESIIVKSYVQNYAKDE